MDPSQKAVLKARIQEAIATLKADIAAYTKLARPVSPDNAIGRLTRMEAITSKNINAAALEKARASLGRLERALRKIDDPDFGICQVCEEPIPHARLLVMPESDLCVGCAEKQNG